ncbi:hypothetical protein GOL96_30085 [Sinorhizobium medicae]|nr:hypothetical protein [Sinorhizobium medicae]MDX1237975.1 hypothetical protein [Sinorhizobium medicae]
MCGRISWRSGFLHRLKGSPLVAAVLATLANPSWAGDFSAGDLIGREVFADATSGSKIIGRIADLSMTGDAVTALVIDTGSGRPTLSFEDAQIFTQNHEPHVVASEAKLRKAGDEPEAKLYSKLPTEKKAAAVFGQQAMNVTFRGPNSTNNLFKFLADFRKLAGDHSFLTREYVVRPGDTVCGIYAANTDLPVTRAMCPESAQALHAAINPENAFAVYDKVQIPQIEVSPSFFDQKSTSGRGQTRANIIYLRLPVSAGIVSAFYSNIELSTSPNVSVGFTGAGAGVQKTYQTVNWERPTSSVACEQGAGVSEKSIYYLFDWLSQKGWKPSDEIKACAFDCASLHPDNPGKCADIVLIDQPLQSTSDLQSVQNLLKDGELADTLASASAASTCEVQPEGIDHAVQHGTHLASIIGSRWDDHGFVGMSPGLNLFAYPWTKGTSTANITSLIHNRTGIDTEGSPTFSEFGPQIFVFASHFIGPRETTKPAFSYPREWRDGSRIKPGGEARPPEVMRTLPEPQSIIAASKSYGMWVVSAMQKDGEEGIPEALEINSDLAFSPVNLGDLPNVIVVTACDHCKEGDASIWKDAFFSEQFVHVAAPGLDVVAPVGNGRVAEAGGTSQAAALVGGMVGAMLNCYDTLYRENDGQLELKAGMLKERLQYTSKPIFYDQTDLRRLAAGVIDPEAAFLDPSKNWVKLAGSSKYETFEPENDVDHWCQKNVSMVNQDLQSKSSSTGNILRMVRTTIPYAPDERFWAIYSDVPNVPGKIIRFDPRTFGDIEAEKQPLLAKADGALLAPKDFDDLILAHVLRSGPCPQ